MASIDTTKLPGWVASKDITALLAAGALTVTSAVAYKMGTVTVIQLTYSDASTGYIKFDATGRLYIGGADNLTTTGTEVHWQA